MMMMYDVEFGDPTLLMILIFNVYFLFLASCRLRYLLTDCIIDLCRNVCLQTN